MTICCSWTIWRLTIWPRSCRCLSSCRTTSPMLWLGKKWQREHPHRCHNRPPQRRQVHALQPHHRAAPGDRGRPAGRDTRPSFRSGGVEWPPVLARGYGGLVPGSVDPLNRAIRSQVEQAVADSDVLLFVVDVESGIHPMDLEIAQYLRKAKRPLILVV